MIRTTTDLSKESVVVIILCFCSCYHQLVKGVLVNESLLSESR
nr:MAG TPA: hypothetical protein [Caudoviricetes sp.]